MPGCFCFGVVVVVDKLERSLSIRAGLDNTGEPQPQWTHEARNLTK